MTVAWPVVMGTELVPVDVISICSPLLAVLVKVVTNSESEVETSGVVLTMAVVRLDEAGAWLEAAPPVLRCVGVEGPRLEPGAGVDCAGGLDVSGSGVGVGVGDGAGVGVFCRDDGGAADDAGGVGVGVFPVPDACLFSPWCRYSSMPSICRPSPRLKADESAKSAKSASSHEFRSMFGVCEGVETEESGCAGSGRSAVWSRLLWVTRSTKIGFKCFEGIKGV